ncbi:MAG: transcription antitermination factor NusB [Deltaproteobacteria bacterium]|nr:transcription antitermination factor NusB [Deltaproteobacteria bacterium]
MSESEPVPPPAQVGGRHRAREVALQVLYAIDLRADQPELQQRDPEVAGAATSCVVRGDEVFDQIAENFVVPSSATQFARELVAAVLDRSAELDELLGTHAKNWRVARMAAVDRNVLRIAVYELRDTETPVAVVIDEAVDLARRFGSDSSSSFVNGVLDAVAREVRAA